MRFFPLMIVAALALSGCRDYMDPDFMPAGYTYLNDQYKAPPGPPAKDIGYEWTPAANQASVDAWSTVANGLIDKMGSDLGLAAQDVYVDKLPNENAFNQSFDYALREGLRKRGYNLVAQSRDAIVLHPEAYLPEDKAVPVQPNAYNGEDEVRLIPEHREQTRGFTIGLKVARHDKLIGEVKEQTDMPAYGYVRGEGQDKGAPKMTPASMAPPAPDAAPSMPAPVDAMPLDNDAPQSILPPGAHPGGQH